MLSASKHMLDVSNEEAFYDEAAWHLTWRVGRVEAIMRTITHIAHNHLLINMKQHTHVYKHPHPHVSMATNTTLPSTIRVHPWLPTHRSKYTRRTSMATNTSHNQFYTLMNLVIIWRYGCDITDVAGLISERLGFRPYISGVNHLDCYSEW